MKLSELIANSLYINNFKVVTSVPGYGATETFEILKTLHSTSKLDYSFHEEVAYGIAHGASVMGTRAAVLIKTHGFAKAMNAITDSITCGSNASFLIFVFDDPTGNHSDNILFTQNLLSVEGIKMHSITDKSLSGAQIEQIIIDAVTFSEEKCLPVIIQVDSDIIEFNFEHTPTNSIIQEKEYEKEYRQHVLMPILAEYQFSRLQEKLSFGITKHKPEFSFETSLSDERKRELAPYSKLFDSIKIINPDFASGETGTCSIYSLPPYNIVEVTTYMGGSIPLAIGAYLSGKKCVWAFSGDFSFIAAGHYALIEVIKMNIPLKLVIFYNGRASATGGQTFDEQLLNRLLKGYEEYVTTCGVENTSYELDGIIGCINKSNKLEILVYNLG